MKNNELLEALNVLEAEKNISKDVLLEAIENSLQVACKNHFGKNDNITVNINPETCEYHVLAAKTVVEDVEDPVEQTVWRTHRRWTDLTISAMWSMLRSSQPTLDVSQHRVQRTRSYRRSVKKKERWYLTSIISWKERL